MGDDRQTLEERGIPTVSVGRIVRYGELAALVTNVRDDKGRVDLVVFGADDELVKGMTEVEHGDWTWPPRD